MQYVPDALNMLIHLWVANTVAFFFAKFWQSHKTWIWPPADFGYNFFDHRRIFGKHKTYINLPIILFSGMFVGYFFSTVYLGFLYALGMYIGSFILSFYKRRINVKPGSCAPFLDQSDYIVGTLLVFLIFKQPINLAVFAVATIITIPVHAFGNVVLYKLKLKNVPW